ncbi:hypothetical protein JHK87_053576 [Glycine soja]|nr:hypothetical protein JHK87_053576 [Glycine soja]
MRIRKRPVLFPSWLSPLRLSDPHLINRSPVVVQLSDATSTAPKLSSSAAAVFPHHAASAPPSSLDRCQPSDQPLPSIGKRSNGSDDPSGIGESGAHGQHNKQDPLDEVVRREGESGEDSGEKEKDALLVRKKTQAELLPPLSPSSTQDGRWYEGEKAIPLKKRRGNFEENNKNNAATHSKKMKVKMKTKMNKKCSTRNKEDSMGEELDEEDEEEKKVEETKAEVNIVSKKRARGSALMEGSRCSRVNGRGWRCCQQTLVGYSLCEHHLGKGRLRSMTSVRSRSIASTAPKEVHVHHLPDPTLLLLRLLLLFCSLDHEKQLSVLIMLSPLGMRRRSQSNNDEKR